MPELESSPDARPQAPLPTLDLRPLSTGELLDRMFFLYRARILLFLSIALVPAALGLLSSGVQLLLSKNALQSAAAQHLALTAAGIGNVLLVLLSSLLLIAGYAISQAATTRLVSQLYLEHTGDVRGAFRAVWPHAFRYIGIEIWKAWSALWVPFLLLGVGLALIPLRLPALGGFVIFLAFASFIYGVIAYLRNSLAIPAAVIEDLPVRAAMRRTKVLIAGRKWRIFLFYLLLVLLYCVALAVQSPFLILVAHTNHPTQHAVALGLQLIVAFGVTLLLSPIASISLCLFYFDERVRREAFDIDFLLRGPDAARGVPEAAAADGSAFIAPQTESR